MAYNTPATKAVGDTITAAEWNSYIRDNFAASAPDVFSAKGDMYIASAANVGNVLAVGANYEIIEAVSTEATGTRWTGSGLGATLSTLAATAPTAVSDSADTQVTGFETAAYDKGGFISGDSFIVPPGGLYIITANGFWDASATAGTLRQIGIDISGTKVWQSCAQDTSGVSMHMDFSFILQPTGTLTITMYLRQQSGGSLNFFRPRLHIAKIR